PSACALLSFPTRRSSDLRVPRSGVSVLLRLYEALLAIHDVARLNARRFINIQEAEHFKCCKWDSRIKPILVEFAWRRTYQGGAQIGRATSELQSLRHLVC